MAPTPDDASHLGDELRRRYEDAAVGLFQRVARAIGRGKGKLGDALRRLGLLRRSARKVVDRLSTAVTKDLPPLVVEAYEIGAEAAAEAVEEMRARETPKPDVQAQRPRQASDLPGPENPRELADRLVREFHPQILRSVDDVYRRIVAEVYAPALAAGEPRRAASQRALDRFAAEGVTGFVDSAGRRWQISSYAEMAMRTAFARAAIAGALDRYRAEGIELVGVPDVPHNCELCQPFEGKVLAIRPGVRAPRGITIYSTVEQAFTRGFGHPNCRHSLIPIIDATTAETLRTTPPDPDGYKATQQQRLLERRIREAKRKLVAALESGADPAVVRARRDDVRRRQQQIRRFLAEHPELARLSAREQVRNVGEMVERAV